MLRKLPQSGSLQVMKLPQSVCLRVQEGTPTPSIPFLAAFLSTITGTPGKALRAGSGCCVGSSTWPLPAQMRPGSMPSLWDPFSASPTASELSASGVCQ